MLYSESRDGSVSTGHGQLRALKDCLAHLPARVTMVSSHSDAAGYREELPLYCREGKGPQFGVIQFASTLTTRGSIGPPHGPISADVNEAFSAAVMTAAHTEWKSVIQMVDGMPQQTDQE